MGSFDQDSNPTSNPTANQTNKISALFLSLLFAFTIVLYFPNPAPSAPGIALQVLGLGD